MTKTNLIGLLLITMLSLAGCGGGTTTPSANTGTGYYVDAAVKGVKYECGTQTGTTDEQGTFTFEEGQECKFSLAGIPLRTTAATDLKDGQEVLEDNPKVAKFLQSIDADGNLSNGIQITDEVLTALTTALETSQSVGKVPESTTLVEVVAAVGHDVEAVSGDVRTDEEVQAHLTATQTDLTKKLLAGKTFYFLNDLGTVSTAIVNSDASTIKLGDDPETAMVIVGNKITDKDGDHFIDKVTDKYILGHDTKGEFKFFFKKVDAEALVSEETRLTETTKELLAGKTFYNVGPDGETGEFLIGKSIMNEDATSFKSYKLDDTFEQEFLISISGNKMIFTADPTGVYSLISQGDGYIEIDDRFFKDDSKYGKGGRRAYTSQADAQAYYDSVKGNDSNKINITQELLNGKTFYYDQPNEDGRDYEKAIFSNAIITTYRITIKTGSSENLRTNTQDYSIENGMIKGQDKDGSPWELILKSETSTEWRIRVQSTTNENDGKDKVWLLSKPSNYPSEL